MSNLVYSFSFGQPLWLLLLPLLFFLLWRLGNRGSQAAVVHSFAGLIKQLGLAGKASPGRILRGLRVLALVVLIIAMAKPRLEEGSRDDPREGIDIMLVCDISASMDSRDFNVGPKKITRREALMLAISEFVDARVDDHIGMIGFAKDTYLLSPMTTDGEWIKNILGLIDLKGGTAIGDGIRAGTDALSENPDRSRVIILVTDGLNNAGESPLIAGAYAREHGVRIYALEIMSLMRVRASQALTSPLSEVATMTGGQYFQASDTEALLQIYRQIDQLETHEIEAKRHVLYQQLFPWLAAFAGLLLAGVIIAENTFWIRLP